MAWIVPVATAVAGYFGQKDANKNANKPSTTDMYQESNPWGPTVDARQDAIWHSQNLMNQRFGTTAQTRFGHNNPGPGYTQAPPITGQDVANDPGKYGGGNTATPYGISDPNPYWNPYDPAGESPIDSNSPGGPGRPGGYAPGSAPPRWDREETGPTNPFEYKPQFNPLNLAGVDEGMQLPQMQQGGGPQPMPKPTGPGGPGRYQPQGGGDTANSLNRRIAEAQKAGDTGRVNKLQRELANLGGGGGAGGGKGPSSAPGGGPKGGGGAGNAPGMTQSLFDEALNYGGPKGADQLDQDLRNYGGPKGADELFNAGKNVDTSNPYRDALWDKADGYSGSAAQRELMDREMAKNAAGYETDDLQAARDRVKGYGGPKGLSDYIEQRLADVKGGGKKGGGGGGNITYRAYNATGGSVGGQNVSAPVNNDPSLGKGEGTYDAYVKRILDADYETNPQLQAMIDMQQRRMTENFNSQILPGLSFDAESSGRFGSDAYQMAQAGAAGQLTQSLGDMNVQYGFQDYNRFKGEQMSALGIGAGLQTNRADNQTRLAIEREQAQAQAQAAMASSNAAYNSQQLQAELAREGMLLDAFKLQGGADQFSMGSEMDLAKYGMDYDAGRTRDLMGFTQNQSQNELTAMGYQRDLADQYGQQSMVGQQMGLNAMGQAVGYNLGGDELQFGGRQNLLNSNLQGDALRFGSIGDAAGLQNQYQLGMAGIQQQADAARRSANVARRGQTDQMNFAREMANHDANMEQWRMANQVGMTNWDAQNQYDKDRFIYEETAPMDFLQQQMNLMNSAGAGGGSSHQWGQSTNPVNMGNPYGAALAGAGAGMQWVKQYRASQG